MPGRVSVKPAVSLSSSTRRVGDARRDEQRGDDDEAEAAVVEQAVEHHERRGRRRPREMPAESWLPASDGPIVSTCGSARTAIGSAPYFRLVARLSRLGLGEVAGDLRRCRR